MMRAVMMKMLVVAIVMVWRGASILAVMMIGDELDDDDDFLSQLLRYTKAELLVGSAKGIENFETVKKSAEENIYEQCKGCRNTRPFFVLYLSC